MTDKIVFRMSEAGACPRALSAQLLGYEPEARPSWLEIAAEEGRWHENRLVQELLNKGNDVYARQEEVKIEYPTFVLLGHIDGKITEHVDEHSIDRLLEIKSMSQYEFDRWMRGKFSEFPEYADQITCYMEATGLKETAYYVKNRSSGYIDKQVITEKPSIFAEIIDQLTCVGQAVQAKQLYPVECDMSTIQCKRCFYKRYCVPTKEEMTVQEEKVLLKAAEDWRKGKQLSSEGKSFMDNAKEIFEEHTVASNLQRWSFDNLAISNITVKEHEVPARLQKEYSYIRIDDIKKEAHNGSC